MKFAAFVDENDALFSIKDYVLSLRNVGDFSLIVDSADNFTSKVIPFLENNLNSLVFIFCSDPSRLIKQLKVVSKYLKISDDKVIASQNDLIARLSFDLKMEESKKKKSSLDKLIGTQTHKLLDLGSLTDYVHYPLSSIRYENSVLEPLARDASFGIIDFNSVKISEFNASISASSSGFTCEEICTVASTFAQSPNMKIISFTGFRKPLEGFSSTDINFLGQVCWYAMNGTHYRVPEDPNDGLEGFDRFTPVDLEYFDGILEFIKSKKTGKWWVHIKDKRNFFIPCSFIEYKAMNNNEWDDQWLNRINAHISAN
ncbi:MAG: hypothetical protein IPO14_06920 [Saprospiraceae bacterium]|nr:hypothetical protein [Saprospiraceae bacterium]